MPKAKLQQNQVIQIQNLATTQIRISEELASIPIKPPRATCIMSQLGLKSYITQNWISEELALSLTTESYVYCESVWLKRLTMDWSLSLPSISSSNSSSSSSFSSSPGSSSSSLFVIQAAWQSDVPFGTLLRTFFS